MEQNRSFAYWYGTVRAKQTQKMAESSSVEDYVKRLTSCTPGGLSYLAQKEGVCPPDQTLLDLRADELYRFRKQLRKTDPDVFRQNGTRLNRGLEYLAWRELLDLGRAEALDRPGEKKNSALCLGSVLNHLRGRGAQGQEDVRLLILRALLLDPEFRREDDGSDVAFKEVRDLRPDGKEYPVCRAVSLDNLTFRREAVCLELGEQLKARYGAVSRIRNALAEGAGKCALAYQSIPGYPGSELERLLLQIQGWTAVPVRDKTGEQPDWYQLFPLENRGQAGPSLLEHITQVFSDLLAHALRYEGAERLPPAACPVLQTETDTIYFHLLSAFDRAFPYTVYELSGMPREQVVRMLDLGLVRVGQGGLIPAGAKMQELSSAKSALNSPLRGLWTDENAQKLLSCLLDQAEAGALVRPEQITRRFSELSLLLFSAPPERTRQEELPEYLAREDPERYRWEVKSRQLVQRLVSLLVRCHWTAAQSGPSPESVEGLERICALYQKRPRAVWEALAVLREAPDRRLIVSREPAQAAAQLYGLCAAHALALAGTETLDLSQRLRWANRAHNEAEQARQSAWRQAFPFDAIEFSLLRAKALALHAQLCAQAGDWTAAELQADFGTRCMDLLAEAARWMEQADLTAQEREGLAADWSGVHARCQAQFSAPEPEPAGRSAPEHPAPQVWLPEGRPAKLFLPWYCAYLDSEVSARKAYSPEWLEACMLRTILSNQNILLTINQAMDNTAVRALARVPGFLQLLREGHVAVSFFGSFHSLREFAAQRMKQAEGPKFFRFSSLPDDFNADPPARMAASGYLSGDLHADQLPGRYRDVLIQFKDELVLLDENLPSRWKNQYFQHPQGPGPGTLAEHLDRYFNSREDNPFFFEMCQLNRLLNFQNKQDLIRSTYETILKGVWTGDWQKLEEQKRYCDPEIFVPGSPKRRFIESMFGGGARGRAMREDMQSILSDTHNRMLGALCTRYQHHLYMGEDRRIMPYDETTPITDGGCQQFEDRITVTETQIQFGWEDAPELLAEAQSRTRRNQNLSAEELSGALGQTGLSYDLSTDQSRLVLARGAVSTSTGQKLLVETCRRDGNIHLELEGKRL